MSYSARPSGQDLWRRHANSREPIGAAEICSVAGGSPLQVRVALARLIAAEQVIWTGKARGTKYEAV